MTFITFDQLMLFGSFLVAIINLVISCAHNHKKK
jgi:hypothetical protein